MKSRVLPALLLCATAAVYAQTSAETPTSPQTPASPQTPTTPAAPATPPAAAPAPAAPIPEEYGKDEFGPGLRALRRGEIVMLGSLPLSLFLTFEVFDTYRFIANDEDLQYAPWPFRQADAASYSTAETVGVLVAAVSVSLLVAVADYFIGKAIERRAAERRNANR
jgi:hypothetical protein